MSVASAKVPLAFATGLIFLIVGVAVGGAGMYIYGYKLEPQSSGPDPNAPAPGGGPMAAGMNPGGGGGGGRPIGGGGPPMGGGGGRPMGGGGGPPMGGGFGGGGGRQGPSSKQQLAGLVRKLDQLTEKPLFVELTPEQRKKIGEQLKGLADMKELSDDEAKTRLEAILDIVKDKKDTMTAAGYFWPGERPNFGGGGGQNPPANPFSEDAAGKPLKSLNERLSK